MSALISCVVAIYNVEEYLEECLVSIQNQKYSNVEIILVDDGSTDMSGDICDCFAENDSRIKVIHQPNQGANCARNAGLAQAKGDWVYFMDGDDYVADDIFSFWGDCLKTNFDILLFSNYVLAKGKVSRHKYLYDRLEFCNQEDFYELSLATMNRYGDSQYNYKVMDAVSIWNKIYRRSLLQENEISFVPGFPKTQDLSFNLLVYSKAKHAVFADHPGYIYRINVGSVSRRFQKDLPEKISLMIEWYQQYEKTHHDERMYSALSGRILTFMRTGVVLYFCNSNNKDSYKKRREKFALMNERYNSNITDIKGMPTKEKILSYCIKKGAFLACEILTRGWELYEKCHL